MRFLQLVLSTFFVFLLITGPVLAVDTYLYDDLESLGRPTTTVQEMDRKLDSLKDIQAGLGSGLLFYENGNSNAEFSFPERDGEGRFDGAQTFQRILQSAVELREWYNQQDRDSLSPGERLRYEEFQNRAFNIINRNLGEGGRRYLISQGNTSFDYPRYLSAINRAQMEVHAGTDTYDPNSARELATFLNQHYPNSNAASELFVASLRGRSNGETIAPLIQNWVSAFPESGNTRFGDFVQMLLGENSDNFQHALQLLTTQGSFSDFRNRTLPILIDRYQLSSPRNREVLAQYFMRENNQAGLLAVTRGPLTSNREVQTARAILAGNLDNQSLNSLIAQWPSEYWNPDLHNVLVTKFRDAGEREKEALASMNLLMSVVNTTTGYEYNAVLGRQAIQSIKTILANLGPQSGSTLIQNLIQRIRSMATRSKEEGFSNGSRNVFRDFLDSLGELGDPRFRSILQEIANDPDVPNILRAHASESSVLLGNTAPLHSTLEEIQSHTRNESLGDIDQNSDLRLREAVERLPEGGRAAREFALEINNARNTLGLTPETRLSIDRALYALGAQPLPENETELPHGHDTLTYARESGRMLAQSLNGIRQRYNLEGELLPTSSSHRREANSLIQQLSPAALGRAATGLSDQWVNLLQAKRDLIAMGDQRGSRSSLALDRVVQSMPHGMARNRLSRLIRQGANERERNEALAMLDQQISVTRANLNDLKTRVDSRIVGDAWKEFALNYRRPLNALEEELNLPEGTNSPWSFARELFQEKKQQERGYASSHFYCDPNAIVLDRGGRSAQVRRGCNRDELQQVLGAGTFRQVGELFLALNHPEQTMLGKFVASFEAFNASMTREFKKTELDAYLSTLPKHIKNQLLEDKPSCTEGLPCPYWGPAFRNFTNLMRTTIQAQMEITNLALDYFAENGLQEKEMPESFYTLGVQYSSRGIPANLLMNTWIATKAKLIDQTVDLCLQENPQGGLEGFLNSGLDSLVGQGALKTLYWDKRGIKNWLDQNHRVNSGTWEQFLANVDTASADTEALRRSFISDRGARLYKDALEKRIKFNSLNALLAAMLISDPPTPADKIAEVQEQHDRAEAELSLVLDELRRINRAHPGILNWNAMNNSLIEVGRAVRATVTEGFNRMQAQIRASQVPWYEQVLRGLSGFTETSVDLVFGNIVQLAVLVGTRGDTDRAVEAGADFINGVRGVFNDYLGGSVLGDDEEFAGKSNWETFFTMNPLGHLGKGVGGLLQGVDDAFTAGVGWWHDLDDREVQVAMNTDPHLRAAYWSLQTAKAAAGMALVLWTGPAAAEGFVVQATAAGQALGVSAGMSLLGAVGSELTMAGQTGQAISLGRIASNTLRGTADSLLFMGLLSGASSLMGRAELATNAGRMRTSQFNQIANGGSAGGNAAALNRAAVAQYEARALEIGAARATFTGAVDLIEATGDLPGLARNWERALESGNSLQIMGSLFSTAATIIDSHDTVLAGITGRMASGRVPSTAETLTMASVFADRQISDIVEARAVLSVVHNSLLSNGDANRRAAEILERSLTREQRDALAQAREASTDRGVNLVAHSLEAARERYDILRGPNADAPLFNDAEIATLLGTGLAFNHNTVAANGVETQALGNLTNFKNAYQRFNLEQALRIGDNPIINNEEFINFVENPNLALQDANLWFIDFENSVLKHMNDVAFRDKDLAASLSNFHKKTVFENLQRILSGAPYNGLVIEQAYNDYKSLRFAIRGDQALVQAAVQEALAAADILFQERVQALGLDQLVEDLDDRIGEPAHWYLTGMGKTPYEANFAARMTREILNSDGPQSTFTNYSNAMIRGQSIPQYIQSQIESANTLIHDLSVNPRYYNGTANSIFVDFTPAATEGNPNPVSRRVLSGDAITIIKKADSDAAGRARFQAVFGVELSLAEYQRFKNLYNIADNFAPAVFVADQAQINYENATAAGQVSVDFSGVGAAGMSATLYGLQGVNTGQTDSTAIGRDALNSVSQTREVIVNFLNESMQQFSDAVSGEGIESQADGPVFTGDDGVVHPNSGSALLHDSARGHSLRTRLVTRLARMTNGFSSRNRMTFVPREYQSRTGESRGPIPGDQFSALLVDAETVEKSIRKRVVGVAENLIPSDIASDVMIAVEYFPNTSGSGTTQRRGGEFRLIVTGNIEGTNVQSAIREAFNVQFLREVLQGQDYDASLMRAGSVDFVGLPASEGSTSYNLNLLNSNRGGRLFEFALKREDFFQRIKAMNHPTEQSMAVA